MGADEAVVARLAAKFAEFRPHVDERGWRLYLGSEARARAGAGACPLAERLAARLSRQEILARDYPPRVWVLLYEPILYTMVDSPQTMYSQIIRVVEASRRPSVTVQVLPAGGPVVLVRDTTNPAGAVLGVSAEAWRAFTSALR